MKDAFVLQARDNTVSLVLVQDRFKALKHQIGFPVACCPGTRQMTQETLRKFHLAAVALGYRVRALMCEGR